jgi:hypothetical protein
MINENETIESSPLRAYAYDLYDYELKYPPLLSQDDDPAFEDEWLGERWGIEVRIGDYAIAHWTTNRYYYNEENQKEILDELFGQYLENIFNSHTPKN